MHGAGSRSGAGLGTLGVGLGRGLKSFRERAEEADQGLAQRRAAGCAGDYVVAGDGVVWVLIVVGGEHRDQDVDGLGSEFRIAGLAARADRRIRADLADGNLHLGGIAGGGDAVEVEVVFRLIDAVEVLRVDESQKFAASVAERGIYLGVCGER